MVAVRAADLRLPARDGGKDGRTALTAAGAGPVRTGDVVVFCKPVAVTRAVVRRDGRVQAGGHPAEHVRLGVIEQQLDELAGETGVIGRVASQTVLRDGSGVTGKRLRSMTVAVTLRATLLMALMPDADYAEILAALFGDLALVPWHRPGAVPTGPVLGTWREAAGPEPLRRLQEITLAGSRRRHREHDWRAFRVGDLHLKSLDGTVTRTPDTPENRAAFGTATGDDGPYPQVRALLATDASTRGTLAVAWGPSGGDKAEAEQLLLDRVITECAVIFAMGQLWVMDRNFPGVQRLKRLTALTHVLVRLKSDITIRRDGDFLPDGSYMARLRGGGHEIRMRIIEYYVTVEGQDVPEMFCLATDLDDHQAYPAGMLAAAYKWRWDGSETALREDKSAIRGAGPSAGPVLRSGSPDLIAQEHAAWITACELVRAAARAAAGSAAPASKGSRAGQQVHPREISFTAARRAVIASVRGGTGTASLPAPFRDARHARVIEQLGKRRVTIDRDRHRDHKTKSGQPFPAAGRDITTRTAPATITVCRPFAA
jgi:hypothetical protein